MCLFFCMASTRVAYMGLDDLLPRWPTCRAGWQVGAVCLLVFSWDCLLRVSIFLHISLSTKLLGLTCDIIVVSQEQVLQETDSGSCQFLKSRASSWHSLISTIFSWSKQSQNLPMFKGREHRTQFWWEEHQRICSCF